jgi:hypothetical protein
MTADILALETQRITAMVRQDTGALGALLADDLSYTHSAGNTDSKASFLELIENGVRYLGVDYSDVQVVPLDGDTAVVRGEAKIRLQDIPEYFVVFLDVWTRREGAWKMIAWQATRIPEHGPGRHK